MYVRNIFLNVLDLCKAYCIFHARLESFFLIKNVVTHNNFCVTLDIDECFLSIDDCHQSSNCVNINGSFLCLCDSITNGTLCQGK